MAEADDTPTMEVRVVANFDEYDRQVESKAREAPTFAIEARGARQGPLPDVSPADLRSADRIALIKERWNAIRARTPVADLPTPTHALAPEPTALPEIEHPLNLGRPRAVRDPRTGRFVRRGQAPPTVPQELLGPFQDIHADFASALPEQLAQHRQQTEVLRQSIDQAREESRARRDHVRAIEDHTSELNRQTQQRRVLPFQPGTSADAAVIDAEWESAGSGGAVPPPGVQRVNVRRRWVPPTGNLPPPAGAGGGSGGGGGGSLIPGVGGGGAGGAGGPPSPGGPSFQQANVPGGPQQINIPNAQPGATPPNNLTFIQRFLALEAIRFVSEIGWQVRAHAIRATEAMGDPRKLAENDIELRNSLAGSLPFGVGKLAVLLRDPTGSEELGITQPLAQAQMAEQGIDIRRSVGEYRRELSGRASVASEVGSERKAREQIQQDLRTGLVRNQDQTRRLSEQATTEMQARRAEIDRAEDHPWRIYGNAVVRALAPWRIPEPEQTDPFFYGQRDYRGIEQSSRAAAAARNAAQQKADADTQAAAAAAQRDLETRISYERINQLNATTAARDIANSVPEVERRRHELYAAQGAELVRVRTETPSLLPEVRARQAAELGALETTLRREHVEAVTGAVIATSAVESAIGRDPRTARQTELGYEEYQAVSKAQLQDPGLVHSIQSHFAAQRRLADQQYWDSRKLETRSLALEENVTGQLAQAYGPGAHERRLAAQVTQIAGRAELSAQQILRRDVTDVENADRVRRIGINQLGVLRGNYLQGFQAQEGSLQRTALSSVESGNPTEVLQSIDSGIKEVASKLGTLVADD